MKKQLMKILVVDDEEHIRESLSLGLTDYGWDVSSAQSGATAMDFETAFDAYIIDLGLPDRDGLDLARQINTRFGNVPIIILSGFYNSAQEEKACPKPVSKFVKKPFKFDELDAILQNLCDRGICH